LCEGTWNVIETRGLCQFAGFGRKRWTMSGKMLAMALPSNAASSAMVSSVADLYEFICRGPLLEKTGSSVQEVANTID
jgi:hypothetical protein